MKAIYLTATNTAEERVKAFLEENASDELAYKINCGTPIEKDGKTLYNRKTLSDFMTYATEEARKLAKGARSACIEDQTVFGWAIHYFEEESIIGKLYNADGTEYKTEPKQKPEAPKKAHTKTAEKPHTPPKAEAPKQEPTPTPKTAQKQEKPTPKPQEKPKQKPTAPEQVSIFDLF